MNRRAVFSLAIAFLAAEPAAAQQLSGAPQQKVLADRPDPVLYEFKHLDNESALAVIHLAQTMFSISMSWEAKLHTVVLYSASRDQLQKAADFVKRYDVPPPPEPQIHFVAYLIRAGDPPSQGSALQSGVNPIPAQLEDVVTEMKKSFVYPNYALLDTVTSVSHGGAGASDMLPGRSAFALGYDIEYGNVSVSPDRKSVNVKPFLFQLHNGGGLAKENVTSSFTSNITIHEGQKLVLGKVRMPREIVERPGNEPTLGERADLFVVLTVKVE